MIAKFKNMLGLLSISLFAVVASFSFDITALAAFDVSDDTAGSGGEKNTSSVLTGNDYSFVYDAYQNVTGAVPAIYNTDGDGWELGLYVDRSGKGTGFEFVGNCMIYGNRTVTNTAGDASLALSLQWLKSGDAQNSPGGSPETMKRYVDNSPLWSSTTGRHAFGTDPEMIDKYVIQPLEFAGVLDGGTAQQMKNTMEYSARETPPTEEEWETLLGSECIDFLVSMEPIIPYYVHGSGTASGGITMNSRTYYLTKREQHYRNYGSSSAVYWQNICRYMSQAHLNFDLEPSHGCHWSWSSSASWAPDPKFKQHNYGLYYPAIAMAKEPVEPVETKELLQLSNDDLPILKIPAKHIIEELVTDFTKNTPGNKIATRALGEAIKIHEKMSKEVGDLEHSDQGSVICGAEYKHVPSYDPDTGKEQHSGGCKYCKGNKHTIIHCDRYYRWTWTPDPTTKFDEDEFHRTGNVLGLGDPPNNLDLPATWEGITIPNIYQMTRIDDLLDLEFISKGNVFKEWQWGNYPGHSGGKYEQGYKHWGSYETLNYESASKENMTKWNPVKGEEPLPFEQPFKISFLSHRLGKWDEEDILSATDIRGVIPIAGYMKETPVNKHYQEWMDERELLVREMWILDESSSGYKDAMYKGQKYKKSWGFGGNWGTNTSDSDVIWTNEYDFNRVSVQVDCHRSYPCEGDYHSDTINLHPFCPPPENVGSGVAAEFIYTPRALFGRIIDIEDTIVPKKMENLVDGQVSYFLRKNSYGNDRITFRIPSTVFQFSPTYKMFCDYTTDGNKNPEDLWVLSSDIDTVQFDDVLDFNLVGGQTTVRSAWSRDYEDLHAGDPNTSEAIGVLKGGNAYSVETLDSELKVTMVLHYWDESFFEPGSKDYAAAVAANKIIYSYIESIGGMMNSITDDNFGFYTNLVGGTTKTVDGKTSVFRRQPSLNGQIFEGREYTATNGQKMIVADPNQASTSKYAKLLLNPDISSGFVKKKQVMSPASDGINYRLNGNWDTWDAVQSRGSESWNGSKLSSLIPDIGGFAADSVGQLQGVLDTNGDWFLEDYEGIKVIVLQGSIWFPAVASEPATAYEKLSDFKSDLNMWAPRMVHPRVMGGMSGIDGSGNDILIEKGTVGAGTFITLPDFDVFPHGLHSITRKEPIGEIESQSDNSPETLSDVTLCYKPYKFGMRGSVFDNAG